MPLTGKGVSLPTNAVCVPGLNCQFCRYSIAGCPLGITQQAMAGNLSRIGWQFWGLLVLIALIFGRLICGWGCPIGLLQDLFDKVPLPKIKKNKITHYLSYLKYIIGIVFVISIPLYTGYFTPRGITAFCAQVCPGNLFEVVILPNLLRGDWDNLVLAMQNSKFYWVVGLFIAMMFIYRPFCRFVCPLGAFYGLFNKFSFFGVKVDAAKCIGCNACTRNCKMDCQTVGDRECISCGNCIAHCPKDAISFKHC